MEKAARPQSRHEIGGRQPGLRQCRAGTCRPLSGPWHQRPGLRHPSARIGWRGAAGCGLSRSGRVNQVPGRNVQGEPGRSRVPQRIGQARVAWSWNAIRSGRPATRSGWRADSKRMARDLEVMAPTSGWRGDSKRTARRLRSGRARESKRMARESKRMARESRSGWPASCATGDIGKTADRSHR